MDENLVKKLGKLSSKKEGQVEGIDQLIFDAFNTRCMIYCLNEVPDSKFNNTSLFSLLAAGSTSSIIINIGKLADNRKKVNSLKKLWLKNKDVASDEERKLIDIEFKNKGILRPVIEYRNIYVAHNAQTMELTWNDVDSALKFLIRVWHLISEKSGYPVIGPTYEFIAVNYGFKEIFTPQELSIMEKGWRDFSNNFRVWMLKPLC